MIINKKIKMYNNYNSISISFSEFVPKLDIKLYYKFF